MYSEGFIMYPVSMNTNINNVPAEVLSRPIFSAAKSDKQHYGVKDKAILASSVALGVAASSAILAKRAGYSLNPQKMFKNIKNSYFSKVIYHDKEIIGIGAGSCLGGLAGGYAIDKNKENRRAKNREAVMQIGNISIPILAVEGGAKLTKNCKGWIRALAAMGCLTGGIFVANLAMNFISNQLFENTKSRSMKATDFLAHPDDVVVAAQCIAPTSKIVHYISRIIPFALMIPGFEVGKKKA